MKINPTTTATTIIPPIQTSLKLFFTGATVGPLVDSVHNQSLLRYDRAPIQIPMPTVLLPSTTTTTSIGGPLGGDEMNIMHVATSNAIANFESVSSSSSSSPLLFSSSWYIPPLLGIAYPIQNTEQYYQ